MNVLPSVNVIDPFSPDGHVSTERPGLQNKNLIAEIGPYLKDPDFLALYTSSGRLKAKLHAQLEARHERHQRMLAGQVLVQQIWNDAASLFQADRVVLTGERILDQYDLKSRDNLPLFEVLLSCAVHCMPDSLLERTIQKVSKLQPPDIQALMLHCATLPLADLRKLLRSINMLPAISACHCLAGLIDANATLNLLDRQQAGVLLGALKEQPKDLVLPLLLHLLHASTGDREFTDAVRGLVSQGKVRSLEEARCVQMLMLSDQLDFPENAWCLTLLKAFCAEQSLEFQGPLLIGEAFALACLNESERSQRFFDIRSRASVLSESDGVFDVWSALAANIRRLPSECRYDAMLSLVDFCKWDTRPALFFVYQLHESALHVPSKDFHKAMECMEYVLGGDVLCFDKPKWPGSTLGTKKHAGVCFRAEMVAAKATIVCHAPGGKGGGKEEFQKWGSALSLLKPGKEPRTRHKQSLDKAFFD